MIRRKKREEKKEEVNVIVDYPDGCFSWFSSVFPVK
jgi:hypothetical protein